MYQISIIEGWFSYIRWNETLLRNLINKTWLFTSTEQRAVHFHRWSVMWRLLFVCLLWARQTGLDDDGRVDRLQTHSVGLLLWVNLITAFLFDCTLFLTRTQRAVKLPLCSGWPIFLCRAAGSPAPFHNPITPKYDLKDVLYNTHSPVFIPPKVLIKFWAAHRHGPRCLLLGFLPPVGYLSVFRQLSEAKLNRLAQGFSRCAAVTNANCSRWGAGDGSGPLIHRPGKVLSCPLVVAMLLFLFCCCFLMRNL